MELLIRFTADGLLLVILSIAGVVGVYSVVFRSKKVKSYTPYAVMSALTALLIAKLLSLVYQPSDARPYIEQGVQAGAAYIDNPGFPSDHALLATVIVIMLLVLTPYKKLAVVLGVLVIVMSVGRVLALVHTPQDIVGGIAAATVGAVWYFGLRKSKQLQ
jgi:membrane-associated phospholipid phosphatase